MAQAGRSGGLPRGQRAGDLDVVLGASPLGMSSWPGLEEPGRRHHKM